MSGSLFSRGSRVKWRRPTPAERPTIMSRLEQWDASPSGLARHANVLETLEHDGVGELLVASDEGRWAAALVTATGVAVPCGDPEVVSSAPPLPHWRLMVGARDVALAALANGSMPATIVHEQSFYTLNTQAFGNLPEDGASELRWATSEDLDGLAALALQLHVDDGFGDDPGWRGARGYRHRFQQIIDEQRIWCVGPVGAPYAKIERSRPSARYGVQLSGIVVDRARRGEGVATRMVAAAVRHTLSSPAVSGPVSLHLRAANLAAKTVYERVGFQFQEPWILALRP